MATLTSGNNSTVVKITAENMKYYYDTAKEYAAAATDAAALAEEYASNAEASADAAATSETNAATSEENAENYAELAKDWAIKTDDTVDGEEYSSKYYAELTASTADTAISNIETAEEEAITNIETAGVYLYSSYVSGATWYRLYSDGFLMQGGTLSGTGSWGYTSITLPYAFKNTNYQVVTTCYHTDSSEYTDSSYDTVRGSVDKSGCVYTKSTSAFSPASRKTKMWVAFGQANL